MPPFVPSKRRRSPSPVEAKSTAPPGKRKRTEPNAVNATKHFDRTPEGNKAFLDSLDTSDESSLSDISSSEFEDVESFEPSKRRRLDEDDDEEDEIDWEDAMAAGSSAVPPANAPEPSGDLELTLDKTARVSLTNPYDKKKGPSKLDREKRITTHCLHVQYLMFHNLVRNIWVCDRQVQKILVGHLTPGLREEVEKWRLASGLPREGPVKDRTAKNNGKRKGKSGAKARNARDWGEEAARLEEGVPDTSRGDPLIRLLKLLSMFWRKRFRITAPGLRKHGYKPVATLEEEMVSWRNDSHDPEEHGERIKNLKEFRILAKKCEGSRDVGAQLFTALLRGLGLDARLVASLQPLGFGWSKGEEAKTRKRKQKSNGAKSNDSRTESSAEDGDGSEDTPPSEEEIIDVTPKKKRTTASKRKKILSRRKSGGKESPIDLSEDDDIPENADSEDDEDDLSVVDVTPSKPRASTPKHYDKDLPYPVYWTEVFSSMTSRYISVDAMVKKVIANKPELLEAFEPRGAAAEKAKQVLAYVVAFSPDGTAKDVTVRYLKKRMWPGKTKGVRLPVEKIPVYNSRGKVKKYEEFDWFKSVMSGYARDGKMRTSIDDLEEQQDLNPIKPVRKVKEGEETLQGYKNSAEYVLERHLKREEALVPGAKQVKTFVAGKGEKAKAEKVFLRRDVVPCKTSESWHKEGREVKAGEHPMKLVPMRAVTLTRKREIEQAEADGGEKLKQGLYSKDQTDWIIPPPIENGIIPRNAFGNIDCYVPSMVPEGAVHLPYRSTAKICKKLNISFAEAVVGFEFKSQRAVPLVQGVVVAEDKEQMVMDTWYVDEEERKKKEEGKREKMALAAWRKFIMGLRILERVREEYGGDADGNVLDEVNPFTNRDRKKGNPNARVDDGPSSRRNEVDATTDGHSPIDHSMTDADRGGGGFFPVDLDEADIEGGGFVLEADNQMAGKYTPEPSPRAEVRSHDPNGEVIDTTSSSNEDRLDRRLPTSGSKANAQSSRDQVEAKKNHRDIAALTPQSLSSSKINGKQTTEHAVAHTGKRSPRRNQIQSSSDEENTSSSLSDLESGSGSSDSAVEDRDDKQKHPAKRLEPKGAARPPTIHKQPLPKSKSTRPAPRRNAARKRGTSIQSHYFQQNSGGDDDDESSDSNSERHPPFKSSRAKGDRAKGATAAKAGPTRRSNRKTR
ncbi:MAG: hypothetical protein M1837_005251 [Sclerophora amabilis]|nr:MAG: hypothetical protein M1837_005251 [Sclerophora amabilis]